MGWEDVRMKNGTVKANTDFSGGGGPWAIFQSGGGRSLSFYTAKTGFGRARVAPGAPACYCGLPGLNARGRPTPVSSGGGRSGGAAGPLNPYRGLAMEREHQGTPPADEPESMRFRS